MIVSDALHQPRPHRILDDVARDAHSRFVISQDSLVPVPLPQSSAVSGFVVKPRVLLGARDEHPTIGVLSLAFDEQVNMIGHEAVRNNFDAPLDSGASDLRTNKIDSIGFDEQAIAVVPAKREEILVESDVVEGLETFGSIGAHALTGARHGPHEFGPAKAGHYDCGSA